MFGCHFDHVLFSSEQKLHNAQGYCLKPDLKFWAHLL